MEKVTKKGEDAVKDYYNSIIDWATKSGDKMEELKKEIEDLNKQLEQEDSQKNNY